MNRQTVIETAREYLALAADVVADYMETHPAEALKTLCKEIDPENWLALESRVRRHIAKRKALQGNEPAVSRDYAAERVKGAAKALTDERYADKLVENMTPLSRSYLERKLRDAQPPTRKPVKNPGSLDVAVAMIDMQDAIERAEKAEPLWTTGVKEGAISREIADKHIAKLSIVVDLMRIAVDSDSFEQEVPR